MFHPFKGGSSIDICGLIVNIPPVGYVPDYWGGNGELIKVPIILKKEDKWTRIVPIQTQDEIERLHRDPKQQINIEVEGIQDFIETEWQRRFNGVWFYNNGKPVYICGIHYFYLMWWKMDIGYPGFREFDRLSWYFWMYCIGDPISLGMIEISKRKIGKCFAKGTLARMYDGSIKEVQNIANGELVMGNDSTPRIVDGVTSGTELMYDIIPNKGDGFTCNESHILYLFYNSSTRNIRHGWNPKSFIKIMVRDYIKCTDTEKDHLVFSKIGWGEHFIESQHFLDPYFLGLWLGDGTQSNNNISKPDKEIYDYVHRFAESHNLDVRINDGITYSFCIKDFKKHKMGGVKNPITKALKDLNVLNNKHIPKEYLIDSKENRLNTLAGIIDSDGHLFKNKNKINSGYEVIQKNKTLAYDIVELARSLGFSCNIKPKMASMKREDKTVYKCEVYRLFIYGDLHLIPCKIERKKCENIARRKNSLNTGFVIKPSKEHEYYGFSLDGNNLFLLADGTIVHNTYKCACSVFEPVSRTQRSKGGIVSKTADDAYDTTYVECLVYPYTNLPFFFKPITDSNSGTLFKSGMRFVSTTRKIKEKYEDSLASLIDYSDADINGYNGPKLLRYAADEAAKVEICDVNKRHNRARECCMTDDIVIGKMYYTTTVEDLDKGGANFIKLVKNSNQNKRNDLGETVSRLYTFFLPCTHAFNFDEYGYPKIEENRKRIISHIKDLEGDPHEQAAYRRMNPLTLSDVFSAETEGCPFHIGNLTYAEQDIYETTEKSGEPVSIIGSFIETPSGIEFMESPYGHWEFTTLKFQQYTNKKGHPHNIILPPDVSYSDCKMFPANAAQFGIGVDPVDSGDEAKYGKSCFAISVYYNFDPFNIEESDDYIGDYVFDPNNPEDSYKELMMCCQFFSSPAFIETNKASDLISFFKKNGMSAFIANRPSIVDGKIDHGYNPGTAASNKMIDLYISKLKTYTTMRVWRTIEKRGCRLLRTVKDLKEFTRDTRGEHDLAVAAGYAKVIADSNLGEEQLEEQSDYFDKYMERYAVV